MRYLINWGTHPPKEEVMHKVWERDTASVSAKNETGLHPLALGSNPRAGAGGEILPLVNPAFNKFPNQLSRERRAPPLAQPSYSPCQLLSSLPFSISLPSPPRQGVLHSEAGSVWFPAFQSENPAKGAAEQRKAKVGRGEERDQ